MDENIEHKIDQKERLINFIKITKIKFYYYWNFYNFIIFIQLF